MQFVNLYTYVQSIEANIRNPRPQSSDIEKIQTCIKIVTCMVVRKDQILNYLKGQRLAEFDKCYFPVETT